MTGLSRTALAALLALTAVRLVIASVGELSPDEAYYFMWSERPALAYYSKGPGIAVAMKASSLAFGETSLGVRLFAPLLALATSLVVFRLARGMFDERVAVWAVVLLNLTPIFNAGAVIMNIDPLSVFFWMAAMLTFWLALHRASAFNLYWPLTGLLIGLGFLCKYTNALLLLSIVLVLAFRRRWRGQFRRPGLYSLLGFFLICTIPPIIWNTRHGWITATHLKERGRLDESTGLSIGEFFEYLGMHLGAYSPIIFAGLLWALCKAAAAARRDPAQMFLSAFSIPIIALYFGLSWRDAGEVNWTAPGFAGAGILLAGHWAHVNLGPRRAIILRGLALGLGGVMSLVMLNTDIIRQTGIDRAVMGPVSRLGARFGADDLPDRWSYENDFSKRVRGWKEAAAAVEAQVRSAAGELGEPVFLIANRYQLAAELNFYLPDDLPVIRPGPDYPLVHMLENPIAQNQFSFWPRYDGVEPGRAGDDPAPASPFIGRTALFITDEADRDGAPSRIAETFEAHEVTAVIDIVRRGRPLRTIKIFACFDYRGLPL